MKLVVDASVAIKWFFAENFNQEADRLLEEEMDLCAPDFILLEISSILWKKRRHGEINPQEDLLILSAFREAIHELIPIQPLVERTLEIAKDLGHSVYDCVYIAVAEQQRIQVITADRRFYDRVKASGYAGLIVWVEEPPKVESVP